MSLWKRIACSPDIEQRMKQYYDEKGLADIRVYFSQWIEERIMSETIGSSTDLFEPLAHQFYEELKQKLITLSNDNLLKFKLAEICTHVSQTSAVDLYNHVRNGLQKEFQLLEQMPQHSYLCTGPTSIGTGGVGLSPLNGPVTINNMQSGGELYVAQSRIQKILIDLSTISGGIQSFHTEYETFHQHLNDFNLSKATLPLQLQREQEARLEEQYNRLFGIKNSLSMDLRRIAVEYDGIQELIINELKTWQRNQALAGNGAQFRDNLDDIQRYIEMLVDLVCKIIQYINVVIATNLADNTDLNNLLQHVRSAQQVLVCSAFIVEKQPPQVMKTNLRFAVAVRWLIGPTLGIHQNSPTVECIILSETQAQRLSAQRTSAEGSNTIPQSSGEILNNIGTMEYQSQSHVFSASFRNMQLRKIKRSEKKGTESVMDEKFALLFYTSTVVNDYRVRVWTLSLPVVVIVHGNQEPQSWATITWDNAFSDIVREPFQVPDKVSWSQLSLALNTKFASSTGRRLTDENLGFLYEKLFRNDGIGGDHKDYITWAQFCKEPLPDRSFTFWDWFFAIMKLTKDHLLGLWKAGLIVGFINKRKTTDEILKMTRMGTFLLRFSDSELGGITVAFVNEQSQVLMLAPWTSRDLQIRGLADRVHDIEILRFLYPTNVGRDEAFAEFYSQRAEETTTRDGYVPNTIRAHVPAIEYGSLNATPQHQMQSPHPQDIPMTNYVDDIIDLLNGSSEIERNDIAWDFQ